MQEGSYMVCYPLRYKRGGDRMSDYELLMVVLTVLSLIVVLIKQDK